MEKDILDLQDLKNAISVGFDISDVTQLDKIVRSIQWKIYAYKYYVSEAKKAYEAATVLDMGEVEKLAMLLDKKESYGHRKNVTIWGFSIVSAAFNVHTLVDVMAQVIFLEYKKKMEGIHDHSPKRVQYIPKESIFKQKYVEYIKSFEYKYLDSFLNLNKHIYTVSNTTVINFDSDESMDLKSDEFVYKGNNYSKMNHADLIENFNFGLMSMIDVMKSVIKDNSKS